METPVSDWSSLPRDLLVVIAKLTQKFSVEDFMAFRATCSSWNKAGKEDDCFKCVKWPRAPFLMTPHKSNFFSLSRSKTCCIPFVSEDVGDKIVESRFGWILILKDSGHAYLLYPFSGARIQLPKSPFPRFYTSGSMRSILSANPYETLDCILVVAFCGSMVFWRPDNLNWTEIKLPNQINTSIHIDDIVFFSKDRKFYAITKTDELLVWGVDVDYAVLVMVTPSNLRRYLVESTSTTELLYVSQDPDAHQFRVQRLDAIKGRVCEWESKRDAIFVGNGAGLCIPANDDDPGIKSNHVYYSGDDVYSWSMYNLETRRCEQFSWFSGDCIWEFPNPLLWVAPSSLSWLR